MVIHTQLSQSSGGNHYLDICFRPWFQSCGSQESSHTAPVLSAGPFQNVESHLWQFRDPINYTQYVKSTQAAETTTDSLLKYKEKIFLYFTKQGIHKAAPG